MKKSIQIRKGERKINVNSCLIDSELSDNTINLSGRHSIEYNRRKRKIAKTVNYMPNIAKWFWTLWLLFVIIGSLGRMNAEEIKFENILETPTINAEDMLEVDEFVEEIEKEVEDYVGETEIVKSVIPIKEEKLEYKSKWLAVTAKVEPTVKNGWLKKDSIVIEEAIKFLKKHEWVRYKAYWDFRQYSICYWTKSFKWEIVTEEICEQRLKERVQSELLRINRMGDNLHFRKKVALISFFYNTWYKSNVLRYAAKWDDKSVVYLMSLHNVAWGKVLQWLVNRRAAEIEEYKKIQ